MYNIDIDKKVEDKEIIAMLFSQEEIEACERQFRRFDKDFTSHNRVRMIAMLSPRVDKNAVMVFSLCNRESPINDDFNVILGEHTEKTWVEFGTIGNKVPKVSFQELIQVNEYYYVAWDGKSYRQAHRINIPEGTFQLKDGNFAIGEYGKYKPNITFISTLPILQWESRDKSEFNLPKGNIAILVGDFFLSKKGTKCFKIKANGSHLLIKDGWGGAFSKYYGGTLPEEGALYYRRASSNGGGMGEDYAIYPIEWKFELTEEDL